MAATSGAELQDISEGDDKFASEKQPLVKARYAYSAQRTKDIDMRKGDVLKLISTSNKARTFNDMPVPFHKDSRDKLLDIKHIITLLMFECIQLKCGNEPAIYSLEICTSGMVES